MTLSNKNHNKNRIHNRLNKNVQERAPKLLFISLQILACHVSIALASSASSSSTLGTSTTKQGVSPTATMLASASASATPRRKKINTPATASKRTTLASTTTASSPYKNSDIETLRSLGMSTSEIDALFGTTATTTATNPNTDTASGGDVDDGINEEMNEIENENYYQYNMDSVDDEINDSEYDDEYDDYDYEDAIEENPSLVIESDDDVDQISNLDKDEKDLNGDVDDADNAWWKDPFADFDNEEEEGKEDEDEALYDEYDYDIEGEEEEEQQQLIDDIEEDEDDEEENDGLILDEIGDEGEEENYEDQIQQDNDGSDVDDTYQSNGEEESLPFDINIERNDEGDNEKILSNEYETNENIERKIETIVADQDEKLDEILNDATKTINAGTNMLLGEEYNRENQIDGNDSSNPSNEKEKSERTNSLFSSLRKRKSSSAISSTSATKTNHLPLVLIPKVGRTLIKSPLTMQIFAGFTLFNIAFQRLGGLLKRNKKEESTDQTLNQDDETLIYDIEDLDLSDEESDLVEDFGFGRPRPVQRKRNTQTTQESVDYNGDEEEDRLNGQSITTSSNTKDKKDSKRMSFWGRGRGKNKIDEDHSESKEDRARTNISRSRESRNMFSWKSNAQEEIDAHLDEIESLRERSAIAEAAREKLEADYDDVVYRLKEAQKQLSDVTRTNNFLKNQVKDSKNVIERVVTAERQKTNAELARVRDQMVAVLERERRIMRHQLMKSSAEVRSMIAHHQDYSDYDYNDEEL